jgi:hypothetical protein
MHAYANPARANVLVGGSRVTINRHGTYPEVSAEGCSFPLTRKERKKANMDCFPMLAFFVG